MTHARSIKTGFLYMLIWCLVTSFSHVFIGKTEQSISPNTVCFYTFLISFLFFVGMNSNNFSALIRKIKENTSKVLTINITTVLCWIFFFYPLKIIEPAIVGAILLGSSYLATIPIGKLIYKKQQVFFEDYFAAFLMFLVLLYLSFLCYSGKTAIQNKATAFEISTAIISCILGGISLALNTIQAKKLSDAKFTPLDTLSVRFILLIVITGIWEVFFIRTSPTLSFFYPMLISAVSLIIIPQLMIQNAISKLQPVSISIASPFMPILTFFLEFIDGRLAPTMWTISGVSSVFLICLFGILSRYRYETIYAINKN
jgi:drug/metabolite transporter (DMT)-like permease